MPRILSRNQSTISRSSSSGRGSSIMMKQEQSPNMVTVVFEPSSGLAQRVDSIGMLSAHSGGSSLQRSSTQSSLKRSSSTMNFSDFHHQEQQQQQSLPPLFPRNPAPIQGETWGHFVDVLQAEEDLVRYSRLLSDTQSMRIGRSSGSASP